MDTSGAGQPGRGHRTGADLDAAVTSEVVRIHSASLGRGPTKAFTVHRDQIVVTVMYGVMTKAEVTLAQQGDAESALAMRHRLQLAMEEELKASVAQLTGSQVVAFMSDNHLDPDMAVEIFVLEDTLGVSDA